MSQPKQHTELPIGTRLSPPDYSYLQHSTPPAPQVYEGDAYVGDGFDRTDVEVLPRLGREDGMVTGPDGHLHSVGVAGPVREAAPGELALRAAVDAPHGNVYKSSAAGRHRA